MRLFGYHRDMRRSVERATGTGVLVLLALAMLWKGGKALDVVWLTALAAGFVSIFGYGNGDEQRSIPKTVWWFLILLLLWTIASFIFSATRTYGFDEVLQTGSLTLLLLWAAKETRRTGVFAERFAQTVAAALIIACAVGVGVYVLQPVSRFVGTFFDYRFHTDYWPNAWAEFVLFAWPVLAWVLWTRDPKKLPTILSTDAARCLVLGLGIGALFLSYSRGGFLALLGQCVLMTILGLWIARKKFPLVRLLRIVAGTVSTAILIFFAVNNLRGHFYPVQSVAEKATFSSDEGTSSVTERSEFWRQSLRMIKAHPVLGYGPYSFRFVQPHDQSSVLATSDHTHNVFLKYASERGVPAAVFLIIIVAWSLVAGLKKMSDAKGKHVPLSFFLVVGIAGVFAHNLIDFNLQFVGIALPVWMAMGMLLATETRGGEWTKNVRVVLAVLLLAAALIEGTALALSSRARHADAAGDSVSALAWYAKTDWSVYPRDGWLSRGAILLSQNELPEAESAVNKSITLNEEDGRAWRLLGDVYLRWNKRSEALRAYEKAYVLDRYNDIGITHGLVTLLATEDRPALIKRRAEFDSLINEFSLAVEHNVHFIALSRNVEELSALADQFARLFPGDAQEYRLLSRRITEHAKEERAKLASRPRGLLW